MIHDFKDGSTLTNHDQPIKNQESRIMNGFRLARSARRRKRPVSEHRSGCWNRRGHAEREETPSERAPPRRTELFGEQQPGPESEGAARRRDEGQFWNRQEKISHEGHPSRR